MRIISTLVLALFVFTNSFADTEPDNNSYITADTISLNDSATGSVTSVTDVEDYYRIVTTSDGNLEVTVTGSTTDFIYLHVFDVDGISVLATSTNTGITGATVTVYGQAAGTYYIRVAQLTNGTNTYNLTNTFTAEVSANDAEPNDSITTALILPPDSTVQGHIGFKNNGGTFDGNDYYQITTAYDGSLKFSVLGTEAAYIYIYLYDNNGTTQVASSTNVGTTGVELTVNGLAAGTYYLLIATFSGSNYNGYTLTDSLFRELPVNDSEPNDTITTANTFSPNSTISGHIGYRFNGGVRDQLDYWKIITTAVGDINIHFIGTQDSYLYLTLYDSTGITPVGGSSGNGTWNLDFIATAQPAGNYYLRIAAFNGPYYNGYTITNTAATADISVTDNSNNFKLFPNPTIGKCSAYFESPTTQEAIITIKDLSGKTCYTENVYLQNANSFPLNLEELANGIYLVQLKMNDAVILKKLVVNK